MQKTEENMKWALGMIAEHLSFLYGMPNNETALRGFAAKVVSFIANRAEGEDLFEKAGNSFERFPSPIQLRRIYENYYDSDDGISLGKLEQLANLGDPD